MATADGTVKTPLAAFSRREARILALNLDEASYLVGVALTRVNDQVMLFSDAGQCSSFR